MSYDSKRPRDSKHDYTALSPLPHRIVSPASFETEIPQTTANAESLLQPRESFHLEGLPIGRKKTQVDIYTDISNNDVAGVRVPCSFGEIKDVANIKDDPPLQKADPLDADSQISSDEKKGQTAKSDEKHSLIIKKVDNMHRVEDGEASPEVPFSEMKVPWNPMQNIPVVVLDIDGQPQALSVIMDTGAETSLIPDEVVKMLKLKKRPIQASDPRHPDKKIELEKFYSPLGGVSITPTHFVILKVKGHRIGLDKFVDAHVRVLETENAQIPTMSPTDIIFGMPFILHNNVTQRLLAMPRDGNPFYALLKGKQSNAQKTEDQKLKEEDCALAEQLDDYIRSTGTASQRVATSTVTMTSWDRSRDLRSGESSNTSQTSQTIAPGSDKDFNGKEEYDQTAARN